MVKILLSTELIDKAAAESVKAAYALVDEKAKIVFCDSLYAAALITLLEQRLY